MSQSQAARRCNQVAIVGIGCRFPGGVSDPEGFWRLICAGKHAISEIPRDRMDLDHYFNARPATPGRIMTRWGGYLDRIDQFDADFFGISPREAERMDPQQRLLLETAWEALEDAGQDLNRIDQPSASVYIGQWTSDFESRLFADPEVVDFYMTTGSGRYAASGRLSYLLGFRGPSLTVDTACSSSLAAIHLAVRSIREGESSLAVAGGVNIILQPHISIAYSQSGMMAPDGRCKFGDASGDGYVRSEGAGLVVLKPLDSALAAKDRIYAVIRGSAINNDGRGSGSMGTPSRSGQEELLRAAYVDAGVSPGLVGYVEAHGTGTRVGDPVEFGALGSVLGEGRPQGSRALVGSVKTNIGHTEGAAGVAGLIKAALSLHHGVIPPSLNYQSPNPTIPWQNLPCEVARVLTPWDQAAHLRFAGISAFGIAGTNGHVVLQGPPLDHRVDEITADRETCLLPLSARSPKALQTLASRYADLLLATDAPALKDVCWSAARRRTHLEHRAAFVTEDRSSMVDVLRRYASGVTPATAEGIVHAPERARVAFVVPGQGAQWIGMARDLVARKPVFRAALERCQQAARPYIDWSILDQLALEPDSPLFRLDQIDVIQPVLVALAIAYYELLESLGVRPDAVVGHSMGEVGAAYIAGVLDLDQAMRVICRRSALLRRVSGQGAMALVELPMAEIKERLTEIADLVSLAASNAPRSSVISGQPDAVRRLMAELEAEGVFCRLVKVDVASHSPQMAPLAQELAEDLAEIDPAACRIPIYSTALGRCPEGQEFGAQYWAKNLRQPVLFADAIRSLSGDGVNTFVELGPHPVLLPSIQQTAPAAITLACGRKDDAQEATLLTVLAGLWAAGSPIDWRCAVQGDGRAVSLPFYPWQRERHWVDVAKMRTGLAEPGRKQPRLSDEERGWLFRLQWVPMDAAPATSSSETKYPWQIFTVDAAMGLELVNAFAACGLPAETAPLDRLQATLTERANSGETPAGIVVLANDDAEAPFLPVKAVQARLRASPSQDPRLWLVTRGGQLVAEGTSHRVSVNQAALWGAGRIVAEEHPDLWGGLVDLDPDATHTANAAFLVREVTATQAQAEVAVRFDGRYVPRLVPAGQDLVLGDFTWRQDAAYLITGGMGGVGLHIANAMAASGARRLILLGRTPLPPRDLWNTTPLNTDVGERIAAIRSIEAMGVAVHTYAVDAGDEIELRRFLRQYAAEGRPPIRGVVHAAATFDHRLAETMDRGSFDAVLAPKLHGAQLLDRLLPDLDFFALFSSTGAFLPLPGGANYAAANAGLDALAQDRRARGLPALSIAWCPWENTGAVKGLSGQARTAELGRRGVLALSAERCSAIFTALCGRANSTIAVFPADLSRFVRTHADRSLSLFRGLLVDQAEKFEPAKLSIHLARAPTTNRRAILEGLVKNSVALVLKIEMSRLDPRKPFGNMGLNSLLAMELRNRLEIALDRPLSATLAWNYPTIEILVDHLAGDASPPVKRSQTNSSLPQSLVEITALSDVEAMQMLLGQATDGKP
jgi:phthiocerol/phenolphthiocerol synthesis type-I polyketide synthase B